jgi:transcription antitermination protein NusB
MPTEDPYTGGIGSRREARERAVSLLYEAEAKQIRPQAVLDELPIPAEPFTAELVAGVDGHLPELDALLRRHAVDWKLERMPAIDRAVLRLGTFELAHRREIPIGAVISEAVELAKQYSTDESGRFVNGLLSTIAREVRPSGEERGARRPSGEERGARRPSGEPGDAP